jgi:hypothetical protein
VTGECRWCEYPAEWLGPATSRHASVSVRPLAPPRDALASSNDGYDDRDPVNAAVPAALDGRSEILSYCRVPDAGFANSGVQWAELVSAQTTHSSMPNRFAWVEAATAARSAEIGLSAWI